MKRARKKPAITSPYLQAGGARGRAKRLHMGLSSAKKGGLNTKGTSRRSIGKKPGLIARALKGIR